LPFLEYVNNPLHSWCACIGVPFGTTTIDPYKIIPIINKAWGNSFAKVVTNQKSIVDRGWWLYNRNLLLHPKICAIMTTQELERESSRRIILPTHRKINFVDISLDKPTLDTKFLPPVNTQKLNFGQGTAMRCLHKIFQTNDIMESEGWPGQEGGGSSN